MARLPLLLLLLLLPLLLLTTTTTATTTVHVVFSNHFDCGFTDRAGDVVHLYFHTFFPRALDVAATLRNRSSPDAFVYTTKAWLVSLFLDCPPGMGFRCPTADERAALEDGIRRGDIRWHAFPFNTEIETMDRSLADFALRLTHDLDDRFGLPRKTVLSQRDVPGTTRAAIPILHAHGVRAMSFGINGASAPPNVPSMAVWRHIDTDTGVPTDMLLLVHPGGYGGIQRHDCHLVDGFDEALCIHFRNDNDGPPSATEVEEVYQTVRSEFPEATQVVASSFDAFADAVYAAGATSLLPVYTHEIGDTWLHGMTADPLQSAQFRAVMNARTECIEAGGCELADPRFYNFSRLLVKAAEHTHGGDVKKFLKAEGANPQPQYFYWSNTDFHANRKDPLYVGLEDTWYEQRDWSIHIPIEALDDHPLAAVLRETLETVGRAKEPDLAMYTPLQPGTVLHYNNWAIAFDSATGALNHLVDVRSGKQLADAQHMLGRVQYQTFDEAAFDDFMAEYMYTYPIPEWALFDYGKLNLTAAASPEHATWQPQLQRLWQLQNLDGLSIVVELSFADKLTSHYGAPARVLVQLLVPPMPDEPWHWSVQWFDKTTTRIPESLWFSFTPIGSGDAAWSTSKVGQWVNLDNVITNGSWHLHGVDLGGVRAPPSIGLDFIPIDSLLASFGVLSPFPTPLGRPDWSKGVAFPLCGNIWGTNYAMWYPFDPTDRDAAFRFIMRPSIEQSRN